ncbi:MAG: hypothetical protein NC201_02155 [Prevotella sp.]|nr:hypothetical protein [Bacteroides sp.]MCM1366030.1 hypothetical protein [Prevotella sp.]MCM1436900.1 hypothetical protein [Prevotella sp.]
MKLKKYISYAALAVIASTATAQDEADFRGCTIFKNVTFYDGYESNVVDADKDDGILRHTNYLYSKKIPEDLMDWFGEDLRLKVTIGAACDNYDRLGNVTLALVPKGETSYDFKTTTRIEIARFITPFMNKNKYPRSVPYTYNIPGVSRILRDSQLREKYDFWIELEVFGIPYDAQQKVTGCKGHTDVFTGTLEFESYSEASPLTDDNVLVPIVMKTTEVFGPLNFNSYTEGACDELTIPAKTYKFTVPEDLADARIMLITSNHGANENGEEYNRRHHFVSYDGEPIFDYTPGGVSCEPYRKYNTQGNMIYGVSPDMDFWLNYSNWCPGQAVPNREIHLGSVKAGEHSIRLSVPDAVFADNQGDFYVSAYLQGARKGTVPSSAPEIVYKADFEFTQQGSLITFNGEEEAAEVAVYCIDGSLVYGLHRPGNSISLDGFISGVYIVSVRTSDGRAAIYKAVI